MDLTQALQRLGGVSDRAPLVELTFRRGVDRGLADGTIVRNARGRYASPVVERSLRAANAMGAVVSHRSAVRTAGHDRGPPHRPGGRLHVRATLRALADVGRRRTAALG